MDCGSSVQEDLSRRNVLSDVVSRRYVPKTQDLSQVVGKNEDIHKKLRYDNSRRMSGNLYSETGQYIGGSTDTMHYISTSPKRRAQSLKARKSHREYRIFESTFDSHAHDRQARKNNSAELNRMLPRQKRLSD